MENFSKNVEIEIKTVQASDGDKTSYVNKYSGKMFFKNDTFHIYYDETSDTLDKNIKTVVHATYGKVEICRNGTYSTRLVYESGKVYKTVYKMPYGEMPMVIKPSRVLTALDENGGKICLDYRMSLAGQDFENNVVITIQGEEHD